MTMDAKPLVSVIIPLYNCEKYLPEALDSLVAQTVPDWEAILVDDCGGLGGGVDAPLVGQPAAIQRISAEQTHGCDQNDDQRIHFFYLFPFFHTGNGRSRTAVPKSRAGETARRGEKSLRPHER